MYGMLGLAEKLHILILKNSTGNYVHYMYGMSGFAEKLNVQICENSMGNCVHFLYGTSGFAEKLNIPNFNNSTENCVHYICTKRLDLQKNWMSSTAEFNGKFCTLYVCNVWICRKIECPELHKFYGKFFTLYVWNVWIWRKIDCHSYANSVGNCVHYTYGRSEFVKN